MYSFGARSLAVLETCDQRIRTVMGHVIMQVDITCLSGLRGEEEQNELFRRGLSKKQYPNSRHNAIPPKLSEAIDIAPYPIDWNNRERFVYVAGIVLATGFIMGIKFRWGGDWDMDDDLQDQSFMDLGHFEIVG